MNTGGGFFLMYIIEHWQRLREKCNREGCNKGTNKKREAQVSTVGSLTVCGCHGRPGGRGNQTILTYFFIFPIREGLKGRIW